ncbi:MAG: glycine cleavage system protein T [Gammaproteobacteria bacterium]|jgi:glycine cleavage system aminomethyltransferase T|nr:glycine cleavage system protein T [Gammaproteobacteria bacterium]
MSDTLNYWTRRSPFFECARRAGNKGWSVANHMFQPHSYHDPVTEYWHLVNGVTLWDVGTERQVEIYGPDAAAFVDLLTPRNVTNVEPGKCRYLIITSEEGGIVNDPVMLRLTADRYWLSCSDSDLLLWAKGIAVFAGMNVQIQEPDVSPVQIQGPKSRAVVESLFGEDIASLAYYSLVETCLDHIPVVVTRTGWSGEFGYEVFLRDSRYGEELWNRILEAGKPQDIAVTGPSDIRRVEAGILGYGCDISLDINPFEAGMERLLDLDSEREFIGKESLLRIRETGIKRRIVGVELHGEPLPQGTFNRRWPVIADERIGEMLVALYSPRLAMNIGYAMVASEHSNLDTSMNVETPLGTLAAKVVEMPFVKPVKSQDC